MRKALSVFIAVCLVLSLFTGIFVSMPSARAATEGDYTYTTSGSPLTATITSYTGPGGDVTIPDTLGGYPVAGIGYQAFSGKVALTNVAIPNSVTTIGVQAFYGCTGLTSVTIPNSVTSIEAGAFWTCTGLITVTIPDSVTSIGGGMYGGAFQSCTKLTSVAIGSGVTSIGVGMFMDCSSLTSVTIPVGVTSIGGYAFENCTGLTNVTIPDSVVTIGEEAFCGCTKLTSVTIGSGVTSIGRSAFNRCTGLTSVTIPNSVTSIDLYAFASCTGLTSVTIGTSVTSIGDGAFSYCGMLTAAYFLGNAPTTMGTNVFPATGFTIWYISGTADWTSPLWYGYPTATSVIVTFSVTGTNGTLGAIVDTASIITGDLVVAGKDVVFTAAPDSSYQVKEWTVDGTVAAGNKTNTLTVSSLAAATAVTVEFEAIPPNADQLAPTGLAGVAPTSALTDGKITGTTTAMEYKLASADDTTYATCTVDQAGLSAGSYVVRYAAKTGFNVGATTAVTVPAYTAPTTITYTVTFDSQDGTPTPAPITGIASGATVTLPADPTYTGYTLNGWFTATTGGTQFTAATAVTADVTVYAQWTVTYIPAPAPTPAPTPAPAPVPTPTPSPAPVPVPVKKQMVLIFQIGKPMFWDNSIPTKLDSTPVIKNSRTLLPIRAIIEALGGTVAWDPIAHKVTVTLGTRTVVLWIGKSLATVNGVSTPIDATDASVVPEIINDRTMLSLGFISENLGATVGWDQNTQTITITYTP